MKVNTAGKRGYGMKLYVLPEANDNKKSLVYYDEHDKEENILFQWLYQW